MEVHIDGEQALFKALDELKRKAVAEAAQEGLKTAGLQIVADAQENLRREHINTTGRLSNTGRVNVNKDGTIDAGFMEGDDNYAGAVEYGRRAGKKPPIDVIFAWLKRKTSNGRGANYIDGTAVRTKKAEPQLRSQAFLIARSIGNKGTKPHPFFVPAVKKNEQKVLDAVRDAIKEVIARYGI